MLLARAKVTPAEAVSRLAGMQAQLARPPFIGLWSRVEGCSREAIVRAAERKEILRATLMRGTIHLVTRADYLAFRPAVQPALTAANESVLKERSKGIDVPRLVAAARDVFAQGACTFATLRERLAKRFPGLDERAMGYIVRMQVPLVLVPQAKTTWAWPGSADFALADTWLGERVSTEGPSDPLVRAYLAAFGPASAKDLQTWSYVFGIEATLEAMRPSLKVFTDPKGRELFDLPKAPRPGEDEPAPVRFLPEYDNLLLAHADRARIVAEPHRKAMTTRNLVQPATVLVDGAVAATWTVTATKKLATLTVHPFAKLARAAVAEIEAEGVRLLEFVEPSVAARSVAFLPPRF
jgi:hypothetical protein